MRHFQPEPVLIIKQSTRIIVSISFWIIFSLSLPLASDSDMAIEPQQLTTTSQSND